MEESNVNGTTPDVTALLRAWTGGDKAALDQLASVLYDELKRIARRYMSRERSEHTLQPTALVNEAFLRLTGVRGVEWQDRTHFFAVSAQIMRRILVNYAVARGTTKRGGNSPKVSLHDAIIVSPDHDSQILELDQALNRLVQFDERKARVVELRFFAGLSVLETATVLKISEQTVMREWSLAKAWLAREIDNTPR